MEVVLLDTPDGNVIARGSYFGGPDYEFFVAENGQVRFRVVGDAETVWAASSAHSFRQIAAAWNRYGDEVRRLHTGQEQLQRVRILRRELFQLGALPSDLPTDPEPLWSLLVFEAENGLS